MDIGTWARASGSGQTLIGIVSKVDADGNVTLFNPGDRRMLTAGPEAVTALPTGTVEASVSVRLDVPHGLGEESVRRWLAALVDPVLRTRALEAMADNDLDPGPFQTEPDVEVREVDGD